MSYELEKQLGIAKALVADYELRNRSLREIVDASERKRGDIREQLLVKESVYEAKIKELNDMLEASYQTRSYELRQAKSLEKRYNSLQESHKELVSELNETISKQGVVIQDLTDDLLRANRENGVLQVKLEKTVKDRSTLDKLDKVLETFE